jgi:tetratricopeptide (TPR) repeat protein
MNPTIETVRAELERLFSLEDLTSLSKRLLALEPEEVGGTGARATFAKALTERCVENDRIDALVDVIYASRSGVDPRVRDAANLAGSEEIASGGILGPFTVRRTLGMGAASIAYEAVRGRERVVLKVLRRHVCLNRRAVQRVLTANRMVAALREPGLPTGLDAGETDGSYWISYDFIEDQSLSVYLARSGPVQLGELKPILRGILEPLSALHSARIVHGDLRLENILLSRDGRVTLIDFGMDRLREPPPLANGHVGLVSVVGSPRTIAPEQVRGEPADAATDLYAFGAVLYELLTGAAVFSVDDPFAAAFGHLSKTPEPPSARSPAGRIGRDVDALVLSLLHKDRTKRPRSAAVVLDSVDHLGRALPSNGSFLQEFSEERLTARIRDLSADPADGEVAEALEAAIGEGAEPREVAEAFQAAAQQVEVAIPEDLETRKALLRRAARIFDVTVEDRQQAEAIYQSICNLDPDDTSARMALESIERALGKYAEVIESLMIRCDYAASADERAGLFAEIGRLCEVELHDPDQAVVAYARALCEHPDAREIKDEIARLGEGKPALWHDILSTVEGGVQSSEASDSARCTLLGYAAEWYERRLGRADLAVDAYRRMLAIDPTSGPAHRGLGELLRKEGQWSDLAALLLAQADATGSSPRTRDLRAEAASVLEMELKDPVRAADMYMQVLEEDPSHEVAASGMARIAEERGDHKTLVRLLERRAENRRGKDKAKALVELGEVFELQLGQFDDAENRYRQALEQVPHEPRALKGLDRIYHRTGKARELLENLGQQLDGAQTPRDKINLFERMASLYEEEFLDYGDAAQCLENVLALEADNSVSVKKLPRLYRLLGRWDALEALYGRQAAVASDSRERIDLLMQCAQVLSDQLSSRDRAIAVYEQVIAIDPTYAPALEVMARLREQAGDLDAALRAIESLAEGATTAEARGEQWMRAGRLLEERGDFDRAIERYKRAAEAHPGDVAASAALRRTYSLRGDAAGVVTLIESELGRVEGNSVRARLYGELARVLREQLADDDRAEAAAKAALELDRTNTDALLVAGEVAFERGRYLEASRHLDPLVVRASTLPKQDATRVLVRFIEAFGQSASALAPPSQSERAPANSSSILDASPRVVAAIQALERMAPDDANVAVRIAKALFEAGDMQTAADRYDRALKRFSSELSAGDLADAQVHLGEALRRLGHIEGAVNALRAAAEGDTSSAASLDSLARVYEQAGRWEEFVRIKLRRLETTTGSERFDLLMEIGDVEFRRLSDRKRATKTYLAALEERSDDRKLLTKLMELFSEEKDWAKLVEVVLRLSDLVEEPKQRAKYLQTAAKVSARHLGEPAHAMQFYEQAIELDPSFGRAIEEAVELCSQTGDQRGAERLLWRALQYAKELSTPMAAVGTLDRLGELYQRSLNATASAVEAYEAAQLLSPNQERAESLAELYASDATRYFDKAVQAQLGLLATNPSRVESYRSLRKLYTEARRADPSWCLCQALSVLGAADDDERRFYERHRATNAAAANMPLDGDDWTHRLVHPLLDPIVTHVFALVQPAIIFARTQPLEALGYPPSYRLDLAAEPHPACQMLNYVQGVLGFEAPPVFHNPQDPGGIGFIHAQTPAIVLGQAVFETEVPNQALAFVVARHLSYFLPGHYVRHLVPTGTGLKGWLFAAVKLCVPQFPVSPDLEGQVEDALRYLSVGVQGVDREILASAVSKLLNSVGAIDLKKWVAAVDLSADRVGFLLSHDLKVAVDIIRATEEAASIPSAERVKQAVLYSVSSPYFDLRRKLAIAVDS